MIELHGPLGNIACSALLGLRVLSAGLNMPSTLLDAAYCPDGGPKLKDCISYDVVDPLGFANLADLFSVLVN